MSDSIGEPGTGFMFSSHSEPPEPKCHPVRFEDARADYVPYIVNAATDAAAPKETHVLVDDAAFADLSGRALAAIPGATLDGTVLHLPNGRRVVFVLPLPPHPDYVIGWSLK